VLVTENLQETLPVGGEEADDAFRLIIRVIGAVDAHVDFVGAGRNANAVGAITANLAEDQTPLCGFPMEQATVNCAIIKPDGDVPFRKRMLNLNLHVRRWRNFC